MHPDTLMDSLMPLHPLGASQCPLMLLTPLLVPEHIHSLPAPTAPPDTPTLPDGSPMSLTPLHPLGSPQCCLILPIPLMAPEAIHCLSAPKCTPASPLTPPTPLRSPSMLPDSANTPSGP